MGFTEWALLVFRMNSVAHGGPAIPCPPGLSHACPGLHLGCKHNVSPFNSSLGRQAEPAMSWIVSHPPNSRAAALTPAPWCVAVLGVFTGVGKVR